MKLAEANLRNSLQESLAKKDQELLELKAKSEQQLTEKLANKETEIAQINGEMVYRYDFSKQIYLH